MNKFSHLRIVLNFYIFSDELLHILEIAKPVIIFCSSVVFKKIDNIRSEMHFIKEIILFQNLHLDSNNKSYQSLLTSANRNTFEIEKVNAGEDVAFLLCSSGTTGLPKCVELTHSNFVCFLDFFV